MRGGILYMCIDIISLKLLANLKNKLAISSVTINYRIVRYYMKLFNCRLQFTSYLYLIHKWVGVS